MEYNTAVDSNGGRWRGHSQGLKTCRSMVPSCVSGYRLQRFWRSVPPHGSCNYIYFEKTSGLFWALLPSLSEQQALALPAMRPVVAVRFCHASAPRTAPASETLRILPGRPNEARYHRSRPDSARNGLTCVKHNVALVSGNERTLWEHQAERFSRSCKLVMLCW